MSKPGGTHLTGIDGLRGLAAVGVLLYHTLNVLTPEAARQAGLAVWFFHQGLNLFFVLSGFLLFLPFAARLVEGAPMPSVRRYATNRILRVWPAYAVVLTVASVVLGLAFLPDRQVGHLSFGVYVADLTLLHSLDPHTLRSGLEVAWTLSVELTFYAVLPLVAVLAARFGRSLAPWSRAMLPVGAVFAVGLAGAVWRTSYRHGPHGWSADWQSVTSRSFLTHADLFAFGMAATLVFLAVSRGDVTGETGRRIRVVASLASVTAITVAVVDQHTSFRDSTVAFGFACLLLVAVLPRSGGGAGVVGRALECPPLRLLGLVSFSLYLWHMVVVRALATWFAPLGSGWGDASANIVVVLGVSLALAVLTYRLVELPAMRLRARRPAPPAAPAPAAAPPAPAALRSTF